MLAVAVESALIVDRDGDVRVALRAGGVTQRDRLEAGRLTTVRESRGGGHEPYPEDG